MTNAHFLEGGKSYFLPKWTSTLPAVKHDEAQADEEHPGDTPTPVDPIPVNVEGEGRTDHDPPPSLSIKGDPQTIMSTESKVEVPGNPHPPQVMERDIRTLVMSVLQDEGVDFDNCETGEDLRECLLHSMLGKYEPSLLSLLPLMNNVGWLSMYQCGFMHRDISIGNLLKLKRPTERDEFHIQNAVDLVHALHSMPNDIKASKYHEAVRTKAEELHNAAGDSDDPVAKMTKYIAAAKKVLKVAESVKEAVAELNVGSKCKAIVSDGDLAAYVPSYFSKTHDRGTISVSSARIFMRPLMLIVDIRALSNSCPQAPVRLMIISLRLRHIFSLPLMTWSRSSG